MRKYAKIRHFHVYQRGRQEWLLLYDFKGIKPGTKFYTNLARLSTHRGKTALIQYSALLTSNRRVTMAARKLATYYGAETTVFKVVGTDD